MIIQAVLLLCLITSGLSFAQQSNKSKSKERNHEKRHIEMNQTYSNYALISHFLQLKRN